MRKVLIPIALSAIGLIGGIWSAFQFADPICRLCGVSSFEGEAGFFVLFAVAPVLGGSGAVAGAIIGLRTRRTK